MSIPSARPDSASSASVLPFVALLSGALAIATAPIWVRLAETGPTATAFWRAVLALPFLALWARVERDRTGDDAASHTSSSRAPWPLFALCGFFFAGDLAVWHQSLLLTSVAASTLEANLAPVFVTLLAWALYRERPTGRFALALALALIGVGLIVAPRLGGSRVSILGDVLGIVTAAFYAGYLVTVVKVRRTSSTGLVMWRTTLVVAILLLPIAVVEKLWPDTPGGWGVLLGLAVSAQVLGQGLIAYALAHLPARFGAVGLYLQPVAAAVYAWWWLGERLQPVQFVGGALVLVAIALARAATQSTASGQSESRNFELKKP